MQKPKLAAQRLFDAHQRREPFTPLPAALAPRTAEEAYAIQDYFVALRAEQLGAVAGYKIALSSKEMQRFVGVDEPQAGVMLESTLHRTPAKLRAIDYVHLIVEFEIAVQMAADLPVADAPYTRSSVAPFVQAVMPAIEIADDRDADYGQLARHPLEALAWIANHLAAHGRGLVFRDVVITGSIITTKTVQSGDLVKFAVEQLGDVELRVD